MINKKKLKFINRGLINESSHKFGLPKKKKSFSSFSTKLCRKHTFYNYLAHAICPSCSSEPFSEWLKVRKFFVSHVRVGGRPAFGFGISLSQVSGNVEGRGGSLAESKYKGEGRDGIIVGGRDEIRGRNGDVESGRGESN